MAAEFAGLADKVSELGRMCARLSQENSALRQQMERLSAGHGTPDGPAGPAGRGASGGGLVSRRMVGRSLGVATVAALGAGALIETSARPAAASTGSNVLAGENTTAEAPTSVQYDGSSGFGGVVLLGNDSTYSPGGAAYPAAAGGWAGAGATAGSGGVQNGVYGFTDNGAGYGVVGWNTYAVGTSGAGVLGRGSGGGVGVEGWSGSGKGVYGTTTATGGYGVYGTSASGTGVYGQTGSTASSANAVYGVITSTSPGSFSAAVRGQNNGTGGLGIGVYGSQNGTGWGVYGTASGGIGVYGSGGTGTGVQGAGATGVIAEGTTTGLAASAPTGIAATGTGSGGRGGTFSGDAAQVRLVPGTRSTHPASGEAGDLYADANGRLWYCRKTGTAGWHQIA